MKSAVPQTISASIFFFLLNIRAGEAFARVEGSRLKKYAFLCSSFVLVVMAAVVRSYIPEYPTNTFASSVFIAAHSSRNDFRIRRGDKSQRIF